MINNTIYQPDDGRWAVNIRDGSTGNTVRNNILVTDHPYRGALSVWEDSLAGLASDYNVMASRVTIDDGDSILSLADWQEATAAMGTPQDLNSLAATGGPAAFFVNPAGGNYQLKPGALAIDKGTTLGAPIVDLLGRTRPQGLGVDAGGHRNSGGSPPISMATTPWTPPI